MQAKNNAADRNLAASADSCPCSDNANQTLVKHIEELNRRQQSIYPLINRLRQRIELQRYFVARMGVQD